MSNQNLREIHGRGFSNPTGVYLFPSDDPEHRRLDNQHDVYRLDLNGSLYAAPELVRRALGQEHPAIIDIGTGSGRWAMEMAYEFPHANVLGIDIVSPSLSSETVVPPNCRFAIEDANSSLERYTNSFDVVHARAVDMGIKDVNGLFYKIARMLKPGGVVLLCTGLAQMFDENHKPLLAGLEDEPGFTWTQRICAEIFVKYIKRGTSIYNVKNWRLWLEANPNFKSVGHQDRFIPIGPWKSRLNETEFRIATGMRDNLCLVIAAFKPVMIQDGLSEEEVDRMTEAAIQELLDLKIRGYLKAVYAWAVRTDAPWVDNPGTSIPLDNLSGVNFSEGLRRLRGLSAP